MSGAFLSLLPDQAMEEAPLESQRPVPQRALIVTPTTAAFDSRTNRIATGLAARGHEVTIMARAGHGLPRRLDHPNGYRIIRVAVGPVELSDGSDQRSRAGGSTRRAIEAISAARAQAVAVLRSSPPTDLVHAMAFFGVAAGLRLGRRVGVPVVYDARDLYLDARNLATLPGPIRWAVGRLERRWARQANQVMTVNDLLADIMARRWAIPRPVVVMNGALPRDDVATSRSFQASLGLPAQTRIVLYHGGFSVGRGIEQLMVAIRHVDRAALVLLGYGTLVPELRAAASRSDAHGRIFVMDAVPPEDLADWVAAADVVAIPIQPSTLNHRLATPNKLFEAMAAGVPVVAADLPGMARIIRETGCGYLCDPTDPTAIAVALRAVLDAPPATRAALGHLGLMAARGAYGWPSQLRQLLASYSALTGRAW